jgi:hypothetical protein
MKKSLLILPVLIFLACESIFHDDDNQYVVIDTQQEKVDILNGIYSRLAKVYDNNYFKVLARSDDINVYESYSFSHETGSCSGGEGTIEINEITGNIYLNLYTAIISINRLMMALSEPEDRFRSVFQ